MSENDEETESGVSGKISDGQRRRRGTNVAEKCELNAYKRQFITAALVVLLLALVSHQHTMATYLGYKCGLAYVPQCTTICICLLVFIQKVNWIVVSYLLGFDLGAV